MVAVTLKSIPGLSGPTPGGAGEKSDDYLPMALARSQSLSAREFDRLLPRMNHGSSTEWFPTPAEALNPPAFHIVVNASTSALFESALQRLQAVQDARFHTSLEKTVAAVSATLAGVYDLDAQGQSRLAAREIMAFVEGRLRKNALSDTNQLLAEADPSSLSSRSMIGLIRSTYRLKKELPAWRKAYRDSWEQVRKLGKNPEALFVGLPSATEDEVASVSK